MHIAIIAYPGKYSYPGTSKSLSRRDMNKKNNIILKAAAIVIALIGLLAMLVAWELLLVSGIHNSTVVVLEMGGVVVCMAGYFLWRRVREAEKEAKRQIQAAQSADEEDPQE
jgi:protein-S-isoprenylcysteine O-methyltransferase Ste14